MGFMPGGSYSGFFGWAEPLRYAGAIALILLLPAVIARCPARRGVTAAAALGLLFGATSFLAQENLAAGIVGAIAVTALLLLTSTSSFRSVATALLSVLAGFAVIWIPVLAYYAVHGLLARFLHLYFLVPQAVAEGYSNTPFGGHQDNAPAQAAQERWAIFFYALPFVLALLALLAVVEFRPLRVAWQWSRERVALVAVVITTILLYQGALLRSDASHLSGTLLVTPGLAIMVATVLPRLCGAWRPLTLAVGGFAIFAASFLLLPQGVVSPVSVRSRALAPYLDRQRLAAEPVAATPMTIAGRRVGAGLAVAGQCCQDASVPISDFITFMNHLHAIIGNRTTYVVGFPAGYPGLVYFVADLTPAPVPVDEHTMVMNIPQYQAYMTTFRDSVLPRTPALVTQSLGAPEARYFRQFNPDARVITLTYRGTPIYVLLRRG
jgi:MFS family permease